MALENRNGQRITNVQYPTNNDDAANKHYVDDRDTSSPTAITALNATAIPAGGTAGAGLMFSSTANYGIFFGSGAPTLAAAKGSLYLRSDGTTTNNRAYINTDGGTTWTALTTAA